MSYLPKPKKANKSLIKKIEKNTDYVVKHDLYNPSYVEFLHQRTKQYITSIPAFYSNNFGLKFIEMMNMDIEEMDAYKMGFIDKKGKELRRATTNDEKQVYNYFTKIVLELKKDLEQYVSKQRLKIMTRRLYTIRENANEETMENVLQVIDSFFDNVKFETLDFSQDMKRQIMNRIKPIKEETSAGGIAGVGFAMGGMQKRPLPATLTNIKLYGKIKGKKKKKFKDYKNQIVKTIPFGD